MQKIIQAHADSTDNDNQRSQQSQFDARLSALDWDQAPGPRPSRALESGHVVYRGLTGDVMLWLAEQLDYTRDAIASGERQYVPPMLISAIPKDWAGQFSVRDKKRLFYGLLLPAILYENQDVLADRARLLAVREAAAGGRNLPQADRDFLRELVARYSAQDPESEPVSLDWDELLLRVDQVPPSLALGQGAYESGYATSRFAHSGNALFGQWDWGEDAMKPGNHRAELGEYGLRRFEYPIDSVRAYLFNLNTHPAYEEFRQRRAELRGDQEGWMEADGLALASTLTSYSERGAEYTRDLQGIMRSNDLPLADGLQLMDADPVFLSR